MTKQLRRLSRQKQNTASKDSLTRRAYTVSALVSAAITDGNLHAASSQLRDYLKNEPRYPALWEKLGLVELNRGQIDAACLAMRRTLLLRPASKIAAINLFSLSDGNVSLNDLLAILQRARYTVPDQPHVHFNYGKFRDLKLGETTAARNDYRRALLLAPAHPRALINIHRPLSKHGQWATSLLLARVSARLMPDEPLSHQAMAVALKGTDRLIEAKSAYQRSATLAPSQGDIWYNMGNLAQTRGRDQRAIQLFSRALVINPQNARYHWNLALAQLLTRDFVNGWASYEWRWDWEDFPSSPLPGVARPWKGEIIPNRRLLVISEQGLGDTLQFVRYLAPLRKAGLWVGLICPTPLMRLFKAANLADEFFSGEASLPIFDWEIGLLSLPALLPAHGTQPADLTTAVQTPARRRPGPLRVGLAWAGNPKHWRDAERSLSLKQLAPILATPDTAFIAIQHGPARAEIKSLGLGKLVQDWGNSNDLFDAAKNIVELDLVITIDSALAHLAASLRVPTWLLVSEPPDWRWHRNTIDSHWYPSVRLYRQQFRKQWGPAIKAVADDLLAARHKLTF